MIKDEELKKEIIKCVCGAWTEPRIFNIEGFEVRGSTCPKCKESYLNGEDSNRIRTYNKLKNKCFTGKIMKFGSSYALSLPKKIIDAFEFEIGDELDLSLINPYEFKIKTKKV
ncbi:MAG: AbrB/MazE/SpoVT family DNA-binding domain-containing protein [Methanosarcinales archaeon]